MRDATRGWKARLWGVFVLGALFCPCGAQPASPSSIVRVQFNIDPPTAEIWRRDGEGNYDFLGTSGERLTLDLDPLEASGGRDLVVDFQVRLWSGSWTSVSEYIPLADLRAAGRYPATGSYLLPLSKAQRVQVWTRAHPFSSVILVLVLPVSAAVAWFLKRRRRRLLQEAPEDGAIGLLDGYKLGQRLGAGAMGEVFSARSPEGQDCAVKFLRLELGARGGAASARFDREIADSLKLSHPNLLAVYGYGFTTDGRVYLASELLRGETLKERLKIGVGSAPELALEVLEQIGSALAYLHERDVVHRDVKPENIFVRANGDLVLMDLGIAHKLDLAPKVKQQALTVAGQAMGTPAYMSPEQIRGKASSASDQYSLGIVLYEILTGQRPFRAVDVAALAYQQIHDQPKAPRELESRISLEAEASILKMMAKDPAERYPSMEEARHELAEALIEEHWSRL